MKIMYIIRSFNMFILPLGDISDGRDSGIG